MCKNIKLYGSAYRKIEKTIFNIWVIQSSLFYADNNDTMNMMPKYGVFVICYEVANG